MIYYPNIPIIPIIIVVHTPRVGRMFHDYTHTRAYIGTVGGLGSGKSGNAKKGKTPKMLEKSTVTAIMRLLKKHTHCFAWKEHGGQYGTAGLPDIIVCFHGMFVAFEVKTPTGKLTKLQETTLRRINAAKGHAYKVTSAAQVAAILDELEGDIYE